MNILKSSLFLLSTILLLASCGGGENNNDINTLPDPDSTANANAGQDLNAGASDVSNTELSEAFGVMIGADLGGRGGLTVANMNFDNFATEFNALISGETGQFNMESANTLIQTEMAKIAQAKQSGGAAEVNPQLSGALGFMIGTNLKAAWGDRIEKDVFLGGLKAGMGEGQASMDAATAQQIVQKASMAQQAKMAQEALAKEKPWFEENKKKNPKIQQLPSGVQYEILKEGNGPIPTAQNKVKVHYHGTLTNGTVFDSSVDRGEPTEFGVTQVIKGWQEILQLMPTGSKWKVYIPSSLAYGPQGRPSIPPNSILIFEVELLEIVQ